MDSRRKLGEVTGISEKLLLKTSSTAMNAHTVSPGSHFLVKKADRSHTIIAFPGSWSVTDWSTQGTNATLGDDEMDRFKRVFPSLKSIGNDEWSHVNPAFLRRFFRILDTSRLEQEVRRAIEKKKKIVFAGHSLGAAIAIFAAIWLLERSKSEERKDLFPLCVVFGAPLVGDKILGHALQREEWSCHFFHFMLRHDIVPRISLSTLSSIELKSILQLLDPNLPHPGPDYVGNSEQVPALFLTVMRNVLSVASHSACLAMGCTDLLLEAITGFVEISPYRPFGTYIFCAGNGRLVHVKNPEAVLQMLFYSLQLDPDQNIAEVARTSFMEHLSYEREVRDRLEMQDVVYLDNLEEIPLSVESGGGDVMGSIDMTLRGLGLLGMEARLGLRASGELEKQKLRNQTQISSNCEKMEEQLKNLENYRDRSRRDNMSYYDAFKLHRNEDDFLANVARLMLARVWDEIVEMLKRYELPDGFEAQNWLIKLGTRYRHLVEPLDIANFYRHGKNIDSGPYLEGRGRPKRYKYIQRWLECANRMVPASASESCIWAEVEEMSAYSYIDNGHTVPFTAEMKRRVDKLEGEVCQWVNDKVLCREDVFAKESTFVKWWMNLPQQHRLVSPIAQFMAVE